MAKASLKKVSEEFIEKKGTQKHKNLQTKKQNNIKKFRQTLYISGKVNKILWQHRVDTGENLSQTIERLVLKYIKNQKNK